MKTKGFLLALISVIVVCGMSGVVSADYFNFVDQDGNLSGLGVNTLISSYALDPTSSIETFNNATLYSQPPDATLPDTMDQPTWDWYYLDDNGRVTFGSASGVDSAPWSSYGPGKDETKYVSVPVPQVSGLQKLAVEFDGDYSYMGLHWGSMDTYNTLELFDTGNPIPVLTITGSMVGDPSADGDQFFGGTNRYVNIFLTGGKTFDSAVFTSTQYAFEFDNLAVGVVPVPGAVLLGILGLSAAGIKLRKFA